MSFGGLTWYLFPPDDGYKQGDAIGGDPCVQDKGVGMPHLQAQETELGIRGAWRFSGQHLCVG